MQIMTKRLFLQKYVLNRANTRTNGLDGPTALREAVRAWELMEKECN